VRASTATPVRTSTVVSIVGRGTPTSIRTVLVGQATPPIRRVLPGAGNDGGSGGGLTGAIALLALAAGVLMLGGVAVTLRRRTR
jgi:hypothetical protein